MSTFALGGAGRPDSQSNALTSDHPRPAQRRKRGAFTLLREVLDHGGPGYLQFAITNICNAKCDFCGFAVDRFDPKQRRSVTLAGGRDVIDICVRNHIGYLLFVGGEPLVHRDLRAMVRYAAERGIHPMICTNGSLWTEQNMRELAGRRVEQRHHVDRRARRCASTRRTADCPMSAARSSAPTKSSPNWASRRPPASRPAS